MVKLHMATNSNKLSKLSAVTPSFSVKPAPRNCEVTPPKLNNDINDANKVASTPFGQIFAAKTKTGKNEISPSTVKTALSVNAKSSSLIPSSRLYPETSKSCVDPSAVAKIAEYVNIFFNGTYLK